MFLSAAILIAKRDLDGGMMVEESLRMIFEVEEKAKEQFQKAQLEASSVLDSARKESEKIKEKSKLEAKTKIEKVIEESRQKAEVGIQELLSEAKKKSLAMERKAKTRSEEAIKLIVDTIVG